MTDRHQGDRYHDGYTAARMFYANQHAVAGNIARLWADPARDRVRGLIAKHWPDLAEQIDRLEVRS